MKYLDDIPTFPAEAAQLLESRYGITTAESFYEHALHEPDALRTALGLKKKADLDKLVQLVQGHLSPAFLRAAAAPPVSHPRSALDPRHPPRR